MTFAGPFHHAARARIQHSQLRCSSRRAQNFGHAPVSFIVSPSESNSQAHVASVIAPLSKPLQPARLVFLHPLPFWVQERAGREMSSNAAGPSSPVRSSAASQPAQVQEQREMDVQLEDAADEAPKFRKRTAKRSVGLLRQRGSEVEAGGADEVQSKDDELRSDAVQSEKDAE